MGFPRKKMPGSDLTSGADAFDKIKTMLSDRALIFSGVLGPPRRGGGFHFLL